MRIQCYTRGLFCGLEFELCPHSPGSRPETPQILENFMAVQQNKKSPSKRGMHRSHNALVTPGTAIEPTTGEVHLRHHISPTGFYRGRKVLKSKADAA
jgi:large subunit ribosomal protein L32